MGLVLEQAEELLRVGPGAEVAGGWGGGRSLSSCRLRPSAACGRVGDGGKVRSRRGPWPARTHSLMAALTLDKQLQSIYLRPYGVGEQVCG